MTAADEWLTIESLDLDAQGVARNSEGKVVFVDGALPGEQVQVDVVRSKAHWERASLRNLRHESALRTTPRCPHFGLHRGACGGCKMQHLDAAAQLATRQRVLEDNLAHLGKLKPDRVLRPIEGPAWGYRHRARLSVRYVARKEQVLVGFHERKSSYVADMTVCPVLHPGVSKLLVPLRALVEAMDGRDRLPQIEVSVGDTLIALVLRHLEPLTPADCERLQAFAAQHGVQWWLQPGGPDTAHPLDTADARELAYALPDFGLRMPFRPTDFTQVNPAINQILVSRAMQWLDPQPQDHVIDWFCGLGNFTLPIATRAASVLGIDGSPALIERSNQNAARLSLRGSTRFAVRNLFEMRAADLDAIGPAARWMIDPPREGAHALVQALAARAIEMPDASCPQRIVYVSCDPATLARDAGILVHQAGYRCIAAGAVNMFPHTAHVESIAVFDRTPE